MKIQLTEKQILNLKTRAKREKKITGESHAQILENIAKSKGYSSWAELSFENLKNRLYDVS